MKILKKFEKIMNNENMCGTSFFVRRSSLKFFQI